MREHQGSGRPPFDQKKANSFLGKYVIVGLNFEDKTGSPLPEKQNQLHGRIIAVHPSKGFCIQLGGKNAGKTYWLPPDLRPFEDAQHGAYRLRSNGEIVKDPDLISNWIVTEHDE